jgi:hypothetical protein
MESHNAVRGPVLSTPSALHGEVMAAIERLSAEFWPGIPVIPTMSAAGTDSTYLRNAGILPAAIQAWPTMSMISAPMGGMNAFQ